MIHARTSSSVLALSSTLPGAAEVHFTRIASFATPDAMAAGEDRARVPSAEIIDATADGMTLVYSDGPFGAIGMIDITDPAHPRPMDTVEMGGEPAAVSVIAIPPSWA